MAGKQLRRSQLIHELERLYSERAWGDAELARRFAVNRTTVYKTRRFMEEQLGLPFLEEQRGRYRLDPEHRLNNVRLTPAEALALYLGGRRLQQQTRTGQQPVAVALEKLAHALRQPMMANLTRAAQSVLEQEQDPQQVAVMEKLVEGWITGRKVRVWHRVLHGVERQYVVSPYQLEPSVWGDGVYLIGYSDFHGGIATFKVARIRRAAVTTEPFTVPDDFDSQALLAHAWGIWHADHPPETVRLRFSATVTPRVKESIWHPSQTIRDRPDGGCVWEAQIAEVREMEPWVRGWGDQVEVLEPEGLRNITVHHAAGLARIYHVIAESKNIASHRWFWAKADKRNTADFHRLIYHLIDVGLVAEELWKQSLHPTLKQKLARWLGLSLPDTARLVAFLAALHDLGKASPAFQDHPHLREPLKGRIIQEIADAGLPIPCHQIGDKHARHEIISTWALRAEQGENLLRRNLNCGGGVADRLAQMLGGHHGVWPGPHRFNPTVLTSADQGGEAWTTTRIELVDEVAAIFRPPSVTVSIGGSLDDNVNLTLLSAIVAVADWIGSDDVFFPHEWEHLPLDAYIRHARRHAACALGSLVWQTPERMPHFEFTRAFPFSPSEAQQEIITTIASVELPALAIIEAPMGAGKTEAAFAVYADWARRADHVGLYVAMPTTATSNQMHDRTSAFLTRQLRTDVEPMLVHAQALLKKPRDVGDPVEEEDGDTAAARSWFLPRKKSLLVPYGVGTVDQALMSVLQTKHFFVRLLGLSHKVVIFDEVHAYDVYMSELFERLLTWLRAVDASVIILSATLPDKIRQRLVRAYTGRDEPTPPARYPRLTLCTADCRSAAIALTPPPTRRLQYDWLPQTEGEIVSKLSAELSTNGGCAAVICNTVKRAQDLFLALRKLQEQGQRLCADDDLILFHARFPLAWREEVEEEVLRKFGPGPDKKERNADRPTCAIVVATQVIEQSLDLDFDVMISDCAPVDLLLQRAGRLQRHTVNHPRLHTDCLWVAEPPVIDGIPQFGVADKNYIYNEYMLLRTWLTLKKRPSAGIDVPGEVTDLIEGVYGSTVIEIDEHIQSVLDKARTEMIRKQRSEINKAGDRLVSRPSAADLLLSIDQALEEDDPRVHEAFRALTRSDRPGLSVVCLHRISDRLYFEPDGGEEYDPLKKPIDSQVIELARHAITIRRPDVVSALLEPTDKLVKAILTRWRKIPALRYHCVAIFDDGLCRLSDTDLCLQLQKDDQLGLRIVKDKR